LSDQDLDLLHLSKVLYVELCYFLIAIFLFNSNLVNDAQSWILMFDLETRRNGIVKANNRLLATTECQTNFTSLRLILRSCQRVVHRNCDIADEFGQISPE